MARRKRRLSQAELADRYALYQQAVQNAELEVELLAQFYREAYGARRRPWLLREDFCGTAWLSATWAASHPRRRAVGVDIDPEPLEWGRVHNLPAFGPGVMRRVRLMEGDARQVETEPAHIVCALNFSYCALRSRQALLDYFRHTQRQLAPRGLLVLDLLGGTATWDVAEDVREVDDSGIFYYWEQAEFDVLSHHMLAHIHFEFPDGSRLDRAFSYHWRLWTLPELRDLLQEAGFAEVRFYNEVFEEGEDEEYLTPTGRYERVERMENQEAWVVYIVALNSGGDA